MSYRKAFMPIVLLVVASLVLATGMNTSAGLAKPDPTKVPLPVDGMITPFPTPITEPIDMLNYMLPKEDYTIDTTDQHTKYSTIKKPLNSRPGFVIMKNDIGSDWWVPQNLETFSYDDKFIYLHRDTSWAHSGGDYKCVSTGEQAGHIRLDGRYGMEYCRENDCDWPHADDIVAWEIWQQHKEKEGGIWVPRYMYYRSVTATFPITVLGFSEANCEVCGVDVGGPGPTWQKVKLVELKPMSQYWWGNTIVHVDDPVHPDQFVYEIFGDPKVAEVEMLGTGAGEHFYYAEGFGQVGWNNEAKAYYPVSYRKGAIPLKHDCFSENCSTDPFDPPTKGWKLSIFNNKDLLGKEVAIRYYPSDAGFDFDWLGWPCSKCTGPDNFSIRFERKLDVQQPGRYTFYTTTDDGVKLWVDGVLLIDQWHDMVPTTYSASVYLEGGSRNIKMEYYENDGTAVAGLSWSFIPVGDSDRPVP